MKVLISLAMFSFTCFSAQAQEDAGTMSVSPSEMPALKRNTIEVRPIETLASVIPGVAASGATFESYVTKQWAAVVGASYGDIEISQKNIDQARDETSQPIVSSGYGYSAGIGVRYYEDPIGGSTYGGAQLDYSELKAKWDYSDNAYVSRVYSVIPSLVVGYRWVWQNGVMARLGAGAGIPKVDSSSTVASTSNESTDEGLDKIEDILDQQIIAKVDLGVGYSF